MNEDSVVILPQAPLATTSQQPHRRWRQIAHRRSWPLSLIISMNEGRWQKSLERVESLRFVKGGKSLNVNLCFGCYCLSFQSEWSSGLPQGCNEQYWHPHPADEWLKSQDNSLVISKLGAKLPCGYKVCISVPYTEATGQTKLSHGSYAGTGVGTTWVLALLHRHRDNVLHCVN